MLILFVAPRLCHMMMPPAIAFADDTTRCRSTAQLRHRRKIRRHGRHTLPLVATATDSATPAITTLMLITLPRLLPRPLR